MRCKVLFAFCVSSAVLPLLNPQAVSGARYPISGFANLQGLVVNDILEDSYGRIWLATDTGLWVWRENGFEPMPGIFRQRRIPCLEETSDGLLCVGTVNAGLVIVELEPLNVIEIPGYLGKSTVCAIHEDRAGRLWMAKGQNPPDLVEVIRSPTMLSYVAREFGRGDIARSIVEDADGALLLGGEGTIYRVESDRIDEAYADLLKEHFGTFKPDRDARIRLLAASDGALWIGLRSPGGLYRLFDGETVRFGSESGLTNEDVNVIRESRNGEIWVGTEDGVFRWLGDRFVHIGAAEGLPNTDVHSLCIDREGQVWIGTYGGGAFVLRSPDIIYYGEEDGLRHAVVKAVVKNPAGGLLVGTLGGLSVIDPETGRLTTTDVNTAVRTLFVDSLSRVWVGLRKEAVHLGTEETVPVPSLINVIAEDHLGRLLVGTVGGVFRYDGRSVEEIKGPFDGCKHNFDRVITAFALTEEGQLYVGAATAEFGLQRMAQDDIWSSVMKLYACALMIGPEGLLWIGTDAGLWVYDERVGETQVVGWTTFFGASILDLAFDDEGGLWAGTTIGLARIRQGNVDLFGFEDGLPSNDVRCLVFDDEGRLFVGTTAGLAQIDTERLTPCEAAPIISVREWSVGEKFGRIAATSVETVESKPGAVFRMHCAGWRSAVGVRYRYRLVGLEDEWSEWTSDNVRRYARLPAGEYTFTAQAINANGIESDRVARMSFAVAAPYWRQGWFAGLVGMLLLLGIVLYVSRRIRLAQFAVDRVQRQAELAHVSRVSMMGEMAAGIAHELNQPLAAINNYANGGLRRLNGRREEVRDVAVALERVTEQAERAGEIIRRVRGFVKKSESLRATVDANALVRESAAFVSEDARRQRVRVVLDLSDSMPRVEADRVQIQQVLLNLMVNGIEAMSDSPSGRRELTVSTQPTDEGSVQFMVSDTGCGMSSEALRRAFDPFYTTKAKGLGMGLSISRTIVENHGGRIRADCHEGVGTSISFILAISSGVADGAR